MTFETMARKVAKAGFYAGKTVEERFAQLHELSEEMDSAFAQNQVSKDDYMDATVLLCMLNLAIDNHRKANDMLNGVETEEEKLIKRYKENLHTAHEDIKFLKEDKRILIEDYDELKAEYNALQADYSKLMDALYTIKQHLS